MAAGRKIASRLGSDEPLTDWTHACAISNGRHLPRDCRRKVGCGGVAIVSVPGNRRVSGPACRCESTSSHRVVTLDKLLTHKWSVRKATGNYLTHSRVALSSMNLPSDRQLIIVIAKGFSSKNSEHLNVRCPACECNIMAL